MSINERILVIMKHYGYNKNSFTSKVGLSSPSVIGKILNDNNRKPSFDVIEKLINTFPDINAEWLVAGTGSMFYKPPDHFPDIRDRIMRIMNVYGLNWQKFAKKIGVKMPSRILDVINGDQSPDRDMLELIIKSFPQINETWLLNNKGNMMKDELSIDYTVNGIKYYSGDINDEILKSNEFAGVFQMDGFRDCSIAVNVVGDMMEPDLVPGEIVLCKPMSVDDIINGLMYLIVTDSYSIIRKVNYKDDYLELISSNTEFDPMIVKKDKIRAIYVVKGRINKYLL
jgi:antitoxin component HigA of HigAB toxin-antitoxin module